LPTVPTLICLPQKATTGDSEGGDKLKLGSSSLNKIPYSIFDIVAHLFHLSCIMLGRETVYTELRQAMGSNIRRADESGMITAESAWASHKDCEAVAKRHLSAESCGYRRTGRPKLDWLDLTTDDLTSVCVRNSRSREVKDGKAIPLHTWKGPKGSRSLRLPDFKKLAHEGGEVVNPTHRPPLPPGNISDTHFC